MILRERWRRIRNEKFSALMKDFHELFGLTHTDNEFKLFPLDSFNHIIENQEEITVNSKNIKKTIMRFIQSRHIDALVEHPLKGHSFTTLRNSPLSNFFINPLVKAADSVTNFAFRARLGSLFTGSLQSFRSDNHDNDTRLCSRCNEIETQHHLLNGCKLRKHKFTKRHDEVVTILRNHIMDKWKVITHANQVVRGYDSVGPNSGLKPDLWYWDHNKLFILEFTIPYGMKTDNSSSSLELRRNQKINKYKPLVEDCAQQFHSDVELIVIIVSSLDAVPKETIDDIKKIVHSEHDVKKVVKKMVITSIRESMFIYNEWHPISKGTNDTLDTLNTPDTTVDPVTVTVTDQSMNTVDNSTWNDLIDDDDDVLNFASTNVPSHAFDLSSTGENISDTDVLENSGSTPYCKNDDSESDNKGDYNSSSVP